MKIWELCNKVKETNATKKEIENWAYMNRICPLMFDSGLDIDLPLDEYGYPKDNVFLETAHKVCNGKCGIECLRKYLDMEISENENLC